MRRIALALLLVTSGTATAQQIDQACMSQCLGRGSMHQYCTSLCSFDYPTPPPVYRPPPSTINSQIAQGVQPIGRDLPALMMQMQSQRLQQEQVRIQAQQAEAQQRLMEEQTRALQLENDRAAAASGSGSGPTYNEHDRAIYMRWIGAAQARRSLFPDFDQIVFQPDVMISMSMIDFMGSSSHAADIAYYLGKNKDESLRIAQMSVMDQAIAIKDIESRVMPK